jgi:hypothetical protein
MASLLDWTAVPGQQKQSGGVYQLALRTSKGEPIAVEIRPRAPVVKPKPLLITNPSEAEEETHATGPAWMVSQTVAGALSTVTITCGHQGKTATFAIRRSPDFAHATTSCMVDGVPWGQTRTVHLDSIGQSELLHAELAVFGHDEAFENALSVAGGLAG